MFFQVPRGPGPLTPPPPWVRPCQEVTVHAATHVSTRESENSDSLSLSLFFKVTLAVYDFNHTFNPINLADSRIEPRTFGLSSPELTLSIGQSAVYLVMCFILTESSVPTLVFASTTIHWRNCQDWIIWYSYICIRDSWYSHARSFKSIKKIKQDPQKKNAWHFRLVQSICMCLSNEAIWTNSMASFQYIQWRHWNLPNHVILTYPTMSFQPIQWVHLRHSCTRQTATQKTTTHSHSLFFKVALQPIAVLIGRWSVWVAVLAVAVDTVAIVSEPLFRGRCFSVAAFWVAVWHVHACHKWTHWIGWNDIVG